jgi:hypothetical protein
MTSTHGRCFCGEVRFSFDPEGVLWRAHCHCESCRRQTSSPFTTWFGLRDSAWRWSGAAPAIYRSSPGVRRFFCPTCGTPMAFASAHCPEETHFYAVSLEDPADFRPEYHVHVAERLPWIHLSDDLPQEAGAGRDGAA